MKKKWGVDHHRKININQLIQEVREQLKKQLLETKIKTSLGDIALTTSQTAYGGIRYWFVCPKCQRRCGVIYQGRIKKLLACRKCLGILYRKQMYKSKA